MTSIEELTSRVSRLEETVQHLTTHHDEQFLEIHDETNTVDQCQQLFNLRQAQTARKEQPRRVKGKRIKRRTA